MDFPGCEKMRYITKDELMKIREKSLHINLYKHQSAILIIDTLIFTGVRVNELIQITPNDLMKKHIIVRGKGNKIRNVAVKPELLFQLKYHIKQNRIPKNQSIFPYSTDGIRKICQRVSGFSPHVFRHSYAIELLRIGNNIEYVRIQLGHSTLQTTQIYLKYAIFDKEYEKLGELFT